MSSNAAFTGSVPQTYHTYLGPMIFEDYARDMARRLAVRPGERILELACGTGIVTRQIAKALPVGATLLATDLNAAMLDVAQPEVARAAPGAGVSYQPADACALPFPDASFDAIACQYGVMFFPDKVKAMREARRVLKPGGRYVFNVWDSLEHNPIPRIVHQTLAALYPADPPTFLSQTPYGWYDRGQIEQTVRAGGFTRCTLETVGFPSSSPTADDCARAWVQGTPLFSALTERGVTDFSPIRQTVAKALAEQLGSAPRSTMRAVVATVS